MTKRKKDTYGVVPNTEKRKHSQYYTPWVSRLVRKWGKQQSVKVEEAVIEYYGLKKPGSRKK